MKPKIGNCNKKFEIFIKIKILKKQESVEKKMRKKIKAGKTEFAHQGRPRGAHVWCRANVKRG